MLTRLSIRNLLLFKSCDIEFAAGLNALTGETGAGKSILLDALGLVLGERSDATLVRTGEAQATVSAEFTPNEPLNALLCELELPQEAALLLRRTLNADGKSRAFVNDAPVTVAGLKRIGELLVERHGQHDQRGLLDARNHRAMLDRYAEHDALLRKTAAAFAAWKEAVAVMEALRQTMATAGAEQDWLKHMVAELEKLKSEEGEEAMLVERRQRNQAVQRSLEQLKQSLELISGMAPGLRQATKLLRKTNDETLAPIASALERAENEVEEANVALEKLLEQADIDPASEEQAEDRLHALRDASRKYRVPVDGLQALLKESQAKLHQLAHFDEEEEIAQAALDTALSAYRTATNVLAKSREKAALSLIRAVMQELKSLKMATTELRVVQQELPEAGWGAHGRHSVLFEVATNKGLSFGPLSKVASGGELSRLLLAMKVVLRGDEVPVTIFDEIDAGTGGAVAEAIGLRLKALSDSAQVLVVTHLPQVAAQAAHHLYITKEGTKQVETKVTALDKSARAEELARMLSGAKISDEARAAAGKLLQAAS